MTLAKRILGIGLAAWAIGILFIYAMLFGSPEFWTFLESFGLTQVFREWWLPVSGFFWGGHAEFTPSPAELDIVESVVALLGELVQGIFMSATLRTLKIVLLLGFYSLACLCFGGLLLRWLRSFTPPLENTEPSVFLATAFVLGQGILASIWLLVALAGLFSPVLVGAVMIASILGGLPQIKTRMSGLGRQIRSTWRTLLADTWPWKLIAALILLLSLAPISAIGVALQGDAQRFHMTVSKVIAASHELSVIPATEFFLSFGLQGEMHYAAFMSLGGADAARLFSWVTLFAGAVLLMGICAEAGLRPRGRLIGLAMLFTSSVVMMHSGDGKVDIFAMALGLAACLWAMRGRALPLTGLFAGLAVVAKLAYAMALPMTIVVLVAWSHFRDFKGKEGSKTGFRIKPLAGSFLIVGAWGLVAVFPHLIKNTVLFGKALAIHAKEIPFGWHESQYFEFTERIWMTFPLDITFYYMGNPSPLIIAFLPFAFLLSRPPALLRSPLAAITFAALAGILTTLLVFPSFSMIARYHIPVLLLFIPLAAHAADTVSRDWVKPRRLAKVVVASLVFTLVIVTQYFTGWLFSPGQAAEYLAGKRTICDINRPYCTPMSDLNKMAKPGARVLTNTTFTYWLRPDLLQCADAGQNIANPKKTATDYWRGVYEAGFSYLVLDNTYTNRALGSPNLPHPPQWVRLVPLADYSRVKAFRIDYINPPGRQLQACRQVNPPAWNVVTF